MKKLVILMILLISLISIVPVSSLQVYRGSYFIDVIEAEFALSLNKGNHVLVFDNTGFLGSENLIVVNVSGSVVYLSDFEYNALGFDIDEKISQGSDLLFVFNIAIQEISEVFFFLEFSSEASVLMLPANELTNYEAQALEWKTNQMNQPEFTYIGNEFFATTEIDEQVSISTNTTMSTSDNAIFFPYFTIISVFVFSANIISTKQKKLIIW